MNGAERAGGRAFRENVSEPKEHDFHEAYGLEIKVRSACGNLAQHQGRKPGPGVGVTNELFDEAIQLVGRCEVGFGDLGDGGADRGEHVADNGSVQRELVGEVVIDHRLVDLRALGDVVHAHAVEAAGGKFGGSGLKHRGSGVGTGSLGAGRWGLGSQLTG